MFYRISNFVCRLVALALVAMIPASAMAQEAPKPAVKAPVNDSANKWDIFLGYSYLSPNGKIAGTRSGAPASTYGQVNWGGIISASRYFNRSLGIQVEGDEHMQSEDWPAGDNNSSMNSNDDFAGGSAGFIYRFPTAHFTPFLHVLGGGERVGSIYHTETWNPVATGGGGLDINTAMFHHHLAVRLFQADYQHVFTDSSDIDSFRLSTGLVYHFGSFAQPVPVSLVVAVNPTSVFPGDPVNATATAGNLDPKLNVVYTWAGTTGIVGTGSTATVSTAGLAPGVYTVKSEVKEGKSGKEGLRPWQLADASASFTVKAFEPPTISCSASPNTIKPGDNSTITASGISPQNRQLTYSYTSSVGSITGSGPSVAFSSNGAPTGDVKIVCNVSDDTGQNATSNTIVTILAPALAAVPHSQALCAVTFDKDSKRPTRVDNEAKGCLDGVALDLQKQSDAKLVLVGEATPDEKASKKHGENIAAQRAVNTKEYLVNDKGIDPSRISVATGTTDGKSVEQYLVPAGADFSSDVQGTLPVDETVVKIQVRKPLHKK